MILLPRHQAVIITPPKTGSTSLHTQLCTERHGGIMVIGPMPDGHVGKHTFALPPDAQGMRICVVVRDPYARFLSLLGHIHKYHRRPETIAGLAETVGDHWFSEPISASIDRAGFEPYQYQYWQLEHIESCLATIGITESPPRLNPALTQLEIDDDVVRRIEGWARPDCERFDYPIR